MWAGKYPFGEGNMEVPRDLNKGNFSGGGSGEVTLQIGK